MSNEKDGDPRRR